MQGEPRACESAGGHAGLVEAAPGRRVTQDGIGGCARLAGCCVEAGQLAMRLHAAAGRDRPNPGAAIARPGRARRLPDNPFVIPGRVRGKPMRNLNDPWDIICERAGLEDMRLHDCRHTYASRALALGESLPMIGRLLGHTQVETTARYAHLAQDSVRGSAVRVADSIAVDILAGYGDIRASKMEKQKACR